MYAQEYCYFISAIFNLKFYHFMLYILRNIMLSIKILKITHDKVPNTN